MKIYGNTNIGNRRSSNQDTYRNGEVSDTMVWSLVCDGMGGVNGGDIASVTAADTIDGLMKKQLSAQLSPAQIKEIMIHAVNEGNSAVFSKSVDMPELRGMGTTAVLAVAKDDELYIAHVGDSRAYLYDGEKCVQVTEDHSFVQDLINRGEITKEAARTHPRKNIITRSLGVHSMVETDFISYPFKKDYILLICSDGLSDYITEELLDEFMVKSEKDELVDALISYALKCGGIDNVTVTAVYNS